MPVTEMIVLRKTPWRESSLLAVGLSGEAGRLDLILRGGNRLGKKAFPAIDLFRVVEVEYRRPATGLQTLVRAELVREHDRLVLIPERYLTACRLAAFVLRQTQPQLPAPRLYRALHHALAQLAAEPELPPGPDWPARLILVHLAEHGLLDETGTGGPGARRLLADVLAAAEGLRPAPSAPPDYWDRFQTWVGQLASHHGLT